MNVPQRNVAYTTLERLDGAHRYNAWIGEKLRAFAGRQILEVGAGIGTITAQLASGAERLVALEVEPAYVQRLRERFAGTSQVQPYLASVEGADWEALAARPFDTVVASNVLEHVRDDAAALLRFRRVLKPGGRLLLVVPALPVLYGATDAAVGHFRRYLPAEVRGLLRGSGFELERLEWQNLLGALGWLINGKLFQRRAVPSLQLRFYDRLVPLLARFEDRVKVPVGMSLFAVARANGGTA